MNKFPESKIYAIEPDLSNYQWFQKNTVGYPNIKSVRAGLWHKKAKLDISAGDAWGLTVCENDNGCILGISIMGFMEENGLKEIDILKMDIEGSEANIFDSTYENWLPKVNVLIIELHDWINRNASRNVFKAISKYNFTCRIINGMLIFERQ